MPIAPNSGKIACPDCGAVIPAEAEECTECGVSLARLKPPPRVRGDSRSRRYVYGKRKECPSAEVIWLLVVVAFGILVLLFMQLLAFMRARKLVEHGVPPQVIVCQRAETAMPPGLPERLEPGSDVRFEVHHDGNSLELRCRS